MSLAGVGEDIEIIVEREVSRLAGSNDAFDEKTVKLLYVLSQVLDHCIVRRNGHVPTDPYAEVSSEDLAKEFE